MAQKGHGKTQNQFCWSLLSYCQLPWWGINTSNISEWNHLPSEGQFVNPSQIWDFQNRQKSTETEKHEPIRYLFVAVIRHLCLFHPEQQSRLMSWGQSPLASQAAPLFLGYVVYIPSALPRFQSIPQGFNLESVIKLAGQWHKINYNGRRWATK